MEKLYFVQCNDHEIPMNMIYPDEVKDSYPCMLLCHGFMSEKNGDGHMLQKISEALAANGIAAARIDFCSMGENLYSRKNYGLKVLLEETKASFEFLQNLENIDANHIGIMGHSLGGRVTFLSSELPSSCLVSLNGAINVDTVLPMKYDTEMMDKLGYVLHSTSDGRVELLFKRFYDEVETVLSDKIYQYTNPIMVCIGTGDPTLDPNVSYNFVKNCGMSNVETIEVEGANHTFHAKTRDYTLLNQLISKLVPWCVKNI